MKSFCQSIHACNQKTLQVWGGTTHARQIMKFPNTSTRNWDRILSLDGYPVLRLDIEMGWVGMHRGRSQDITMKGKFWRRHHCQRHINIPQVGTINNLTMCYMGVSYLTQSMCYMGVSYLTQWQFCWRSTWERTFGFYIRDIRSSNCE